MPIEENDDGFVFGKIVLPLVRNGSNLKREDFLLSEHYQSVLLVNIGLHCIDSGQVAITCISVEPFLDYYPLAMFMHKPQSMNLISLHHAMPFSLES